MYLTYVRPIGKRFGGSTAGTTVMIGINPELSNASGTCHVTSTVLSSSGALNWIFGGQSK
jgi:hypothetical protein